MALKKWSVYTFQAQDADNNIIATLRYASDGSQKDLQLSADSLKRNYPATAQVHAYKLTAIIEYKK